MKYKKTISVLCTLLLCTICFPSTIKPASALTYSSSQDIEFTFNSFISINLSSPNLIISDLTPGEASDSNTITVGATTNASMGYQLSATVGQKNGTDALVNTTSNSYTFTNLTSTTATLSNFADNTWGYSYCADSSTNCGNGGSATWVSGSRGNATAGYAGLPLDDNDNASERGQGGVLLLNTSGPEDTLQSIQFKIGAKASNGQASGDYTNTINFYAVANPEPQLGPVACEAGKICYNPNGYSVVEGTMGKQSAGDNASKTLLASNFSQRGYGFAGWSTTYDYSDPNGFYGPQETITTPADTSTTGLSLYAHWVRSAGSLQNFNCPDNTTMPIGTVTALTDARDNETYAVAKLADGNCWMIENLRLEANNSSNEALAQGFGKSTTYGNFIGLADSESPNNFQANDPPVANSKYSPTTDGDKMVIGTNNYSWARMPRYHNVNNQSNSANRPQDPTTNAATNSTTNAGMYSYGNYYSWAAAMANTIYYSGATSETAGTSLCPAGWQLPYGRSTGRGASSGGFSYLDRMLGGNGSGSDSNTTPTGTEMANRYRKYPNNFLYSGHISLSTSVTVNSRGSIGFYWSSTTFSNYNAYSMYIYPNDVRPGTTSDSHTGGEPVRCLALQGS